MIENFEKASIYARKLFKEDEKILDIKREAIEQKIPIITEEVLAYMIFILKEHKPINSLEIGTAVAYSTYYISKYSKNMTSIEIDETRYNKAKENLKKLDVNVNCILADATKELSKLNEKYDFIFIDASKGQYQVFFDLCIDKLNNGGIIFIDNIMFRSYVALEQYPKKYKSLVKKLDKFIMYLNENYNFAILPFGDGVGIVRKD